MKKSKKRLTYFGRVISFILVVSFAILSYMLLKLNILPNKYLTLYFGVLGFLTLLYVFILSKMSFKKKLKIVVMLFSIINIAVFSVGCMYLNDTYEFFKNGFIQIDYITEEYYVLVNKDSSYGNIKDLESKKIYTFNEQMDIYNKAIEELNKLVSINIVESDSVQTMGENLMANKVDSILLSSVHKTTLDEDLEGFRDSVKVLKTLKVKVKTESGGITHPDIDISEHPFVVFISGSDSYGNIAARSRSDVNMIATVNPNTHEVLLTSIPRDYYVQLHNTTGYKDKLTHAGMYGVNMSINTISDFMGIDIDYYFKVNFSTLVKLIDAIGGVDVYSDKQFVPWTNRRLVIKKGVNHMNGEMAIAFARERKTYLEGDRHRIQNQQDVLSAIVKKVSNSTVLINKYSTILNSISSTFDTNVDGKDIQKFAKLQIDEMPSWTIKNYNLNGSDSSDYTYSCGKQKLYVMIPDDETVTTASKYINGMKEGKTFAELGIE